MRICYVHYLYGEDTALHHARQFAAAVENAGHEIAVHALNLAPIDHGGASLRHQARAWLKARVSRYLHEPKELLWNAPYVRKILAIARAERPDVLVVRDHALTFAEVVARAVTGLPLVLEVNAPAGESARYFDEYAHLPGASFLTERLKVRHADRVTVVSGALKSHLVETHGVPGGKILVNPNGADCEQFHPGVDGGAVRARWRLVDRAVIGFVGSLHPWHGPEILQGLIAATDDPQVGFLLVGDGQGWPRMREWIAARGFEKRVALAGRVAHEEVPAHVAAMDIALIPDSNEYGSSLKTLEYMAAGRAIVAPRYAPFQEILEHGREGMLFPPGDLESMMAIIKELLRDRDQRERLGLGARRRVVDQFTWKHNALRVLEACQASRELRSRPRSAANPVED